jgi:hypothetical protein
MTQAHDVVRVGPGLEDRDTLFAILQYPSCARTRMQKQVASSHKPLPLTHSLPPTGLGFFPTWAGCCCFSHVLTACLPSFEPSSAHVVGQRFIAQHARCGTFQAGQITLAEWMLGVQGETDQMRSR